MSTRRTFPLADLLPNPHRDLDAFPVADGDVEALLKSFARSGVRAEGGLRVRINEDGAPELCAGHALLEALRRFHDDPDHEVEVTVEEVSAAGMLLRMVDENEVRRQHSARMDQEATAAVVRAFARGEVELEMPPKRAARAKLRFAPSFSMGDDPDPPETSPDHAYTARTVAAFLGWSPKRVEQSLGALELIEEGRVEPSSFTGMSGQEAASYVRNVRAALAGGGNGSANGSNGDKSGGNPDREEDTRGQSDRDAPLLREFTDFRDGAVKDVRDLTVDFLEAADAGEVEAETREEIEEAIRDLVASLESLLEKVAP